MSSLIFNGDLATWNGHKVGGSSAHLTTSKGGNITHQSLVTIALFSVHHLVEVPQ